MVDWRQQVDTSRPDYGGGRVVLWPHKQGLRTRRLPLRELVPHRQNRARQRAGGERGLCERCGIKVEQRFLEQWFFRISAFAERLLNNLIGLTGRVTKQAQRN